MANRYLVVCRAGNSSLHKEWLSNVEYKNFDLLIDYYGDEEQKYRADADFYSQHKSYKWPVMYRLIRESPDFFFQYEAVWFPDDDLLTDTHNIHDMFETFSEHQLLLAQPALTDDSYHSYALTFRNRLFKLRYVDFIEVMAPIFSREALQQCYPTFNLGNTGWGMDYVWPKVLGYPTYGVAVLDASPVKHTRPVGSGEIYQQGLEAARAESKRMLEFFAIDPKGNTSAYGGIPLQQDESYSNGNIASLILKGSRDGLQSIERCVTEYFYPTVQNILDYEQGYHNRHSGIKNILPPFEKLANILFTFSVFNSENVGELVLREISPLDDNDIFEFVGWYGGDKLILLNSIAIGFYNNEIFDRVLPFLLNAFQLDNDDFETLFNLGTILHQFGDNRLALGYLERITDKNVDVYQLIDQIRMALETEESIR